MAEAIIDKTTQDQISELKNLRNEVEGIGDISKKSESWRLIRKEIDDKFGKQFEEIMKTPEQAEGEKPVAPEIVLQDREQYDEESKETTVKKDGWKDLGWSDEQIETIRKQLQEKLNLTPEQSLTALENLVAVGKTFWDLQKLLHDEETERQVDREAQHATDVAHQTSYTRDYNVWYKFSYLKELGIEREDYLKHFILDKDFAKDNDHEFLTNRPRNLEELAWNITQEKTKEFGVYGRFPVLKLQVEVNKENPKRTVIDENGKEREVPNVKGRYVVNHANFLRWMYWQINEWYVIDTDDVTNYFEKVKITKDQFTSIDLNTILLDHNRFFTDEESKYHDELYKYIFLVPWMLYFIRTYDLEYKIAMGTGREKLAEKLDQLFFLNKLTKKSFGKSMLYYLTTLPVDLDSNATQSDSKMGAAWLKMFLAYNNFSDLDGLKEVLGPDNKFFTRDGMMDAIRKVAGKKYGETGMPSIGNFLGRKAKFFEDAFDENGNIRADKKREGEEAFLQFINFFGTGIKTPYDATDVVQQALKDAIADTLVSKEANGSKITDKSKKANGDNSIDGQVLDEQSLGVVELIAQSFLRFTGVAAKNDFPVLAAYDSATVLYNTEAYRRKMATTSRGGSTGNPFTIPQFKRIVVPLFEGIEVESAEAEYQVYNEKDDRLETKTRKKTPQEIMMEMSLGYLADEKDRKDKETTIHEKEMTLKTARKDKSMTEDALTALQKEIDDLRAEYRDFEKKEKDKYKTNAEQIGFDENALRDYVKNHYMNGAKIYDQVFGAQEIDFDKFTKYDGLLRGVNFDRAEFQKQVKENFFKPLRYLYSTYDSIHMNMLVRAPVFKGRDSKDSDHWRFEEMPLGEAIFGYQILNIPEFRQEAEHFQKLNPEAWEAMKEDGYKKKGKYIKSPDGRYVIDYDKVENNKVLAYKQWALMKIGADMWTHITRHSTDPSYNMAHYMDVIQAIATIGGEVLGDDVDMTKTRVVKPYFSEGQLKWLKKMSKTTTSRLFTRQLFEDIFIGDKRKKESKFGESVNFIIAGIFKGY